MQDVTFVVTGALFMASWLLHDFAPQTRLFRAIGFLMLPAGLLAIVGRVRLPITATAVDAAFAVTGLCWIAFLAIQLPRWSRELRAAARD